MSRHGEWTLLVIVLYVLAGVAILYACCEHIIVRRLHARELERRREAWTNG